MKLNMGILSSGAGRAAGTTEISAISGDEYPIAFEDDVDQFPVLPSALADPCYMRSLGMASPLSKSGQFLAEAFIDEKLHKLNDALRSS